MNHKAYKGAISSSKDLVTSYEDIRAGFVSLALEKSRLASPFIDQARALKSRASSAKTPQQLLNISRMQSAMLAAAGVSNKAAGHMEDEDKKEAIKGLIDNFLVPSGDKFVEELVFRFLLTRGATLGGSMNNISGELAERKLSRSIIAALRLSERGYKWLDKRTSSWVSESDNDADIELSLRGISWSTQDQKRTLIYNLTIPAIRKNMDICVFSCDESLFDMRATPRDASSYMAIGELKGGIDPAGADEHWKTASKALIRVREGFAQENLSPHTFFVAAAIATSMAQEILTELEVGTLSNAANLNNADQVASLCRWLIDL